MHFIFSLLLSSAFGGIDRAAISCATEECVETSIQQSILLGGSGFSVILIGTMDTTAARHIRFANNAINDAITVQDLRYLDRLVRGGQVSGMVLNLSTQIDIKYVRLTHELTAEMMHEMLTQLRKAQVPNFQGTPTARPVITMQSQYSTWQPRHVIPLRQLDVQTRSYYDIKAGLKMQLNPKIPVLLQITSLHDRELNAMISRAHQQVRMGRNLQWFGAFLLVSAVGNFFLDFAISPTPSSIDTERIVR